MKLSTWAKKHGFTYKGAHNLFQRGQIPGAYQLGSGTILIEEKIPETQNVVVYCRVSNRERKEELEYQVNRCLEYCRAKGYSVNKIHREIASGMNDRRKELIKMLESNPTIIICENKDRLTRFGFNYLEILLKKQNCKIDIINRDMVNETDLIKDMVSIMTSFCCRLYGARRGQNKAKKIKDVINDPNN